MSKNKPGWLRRLLNPRLRGKGKQQLAQVRPQPIAERVPRGNQWTFDEVIERQVTERSSAGAAIEQIITVFQRSEDGWVEEMVDLFERRIEGDAHLRAALDNRNEAVSQKPWTIEPGPAAGRETEEDRRAAAELELRLRKIPNFVHTLEHQLTFNPYGWAGSEITWDMVDGMASPVWFQDVAHRRFTFERETDRPMLRTTEDPIDGDPLIPGKWWWSSRRGRLTSGAGLMRTLVWWSTFKTLAIRDWVIFAERFGIPYVTGTYDETISDQDKEILRQAVRDLGSSGFAIFSEAAKINIVSGDGDRNHDESVHSVLVGVCDNQISFLVEGATLVSSVDGPGSHALGKVHEGRYFDILLGDAERLSSSFEASVGLPFVKFNGLNARPPRLKMHLGLNLSLKDLVEIATTLPNKLDGFEVDEEQIRAMTLLRKPRAGQGLRGVDIAKIEQQARGADDRGTPPEGE